MATFLKFPESKTVTTEVAAAPIPRPEYPRPQFVRQEWANLNGQWQFRTDDQDVGLEQGWFSSFDYPLTIQVPFAPEAALSGIGDRSFHPCVWYRRAFRIPDAWRGWRILMNLGAIDYRASVWVNGVFTAGHEGGHTPFSCDITRALQDGDNFVAVRAEDPPTDRYIPRGKQHWEAAPVSIFYARTTGIWQTVWIEPVSPSHLASVRITPQLSGAVEFAVKIAGLGESQLVTVTLHDQGHLLSTATSLAQGPRVVISGHVAEPRLWSPDDPYLYTARLELLGPTGVLDTVDTYFGCRSVATQDGKVLLNGSPIYLRTVLDQGYWPESNLTPPSDQAIQDDIRWTKDLGFNGVRKHQKVEDPRFLYWADRMGLLVAAEMANAYLFDEDAVARMTREWIEVVSRDYNHPSIIIWTPVNESWGVPNLTDRRQQAHLKALYYLTKSLDDTRLVIDNDGWEHTDVTDLFAIHDYTRTGEELQRRFQNIARGVPLPLYGKMYLVPGSQYNGTPILFWEFGGIGFILPTDAGTVPQNSWGYSGVEKTGEEALQRMRGLYQAIARTPQIAGVCYTQLYDVEQEVNGLMTYDRRMKFDPAVIRAINSLLI